MNISITLAVREEAPEIADVMNEASQELTRLYGKGSWSYEVTSPVIKNNIDRHSRLIVAKNNNRVIATLRLTTKKPWAIDPVYFTKVRQPIYLVDMAVSPALQRKGLGTLMIDRARSMVVQWPGNAIRLDAYEGEAGAVGFYLKCGFVEKGRVVFRQTGLVYFEYLL